MTALDHASGWSIKNRLLVGLAAISIVVYGVIAMVRMPVDVFPDLTAPTVTVITEARGLAPQEVETLVTFPIEGEVLSGARSSGARSSPGLIGARGPRVREVLSGARGPLRRGPLRG